MDNTTENNKLMAEFMDFQSTSLGWFDNEEHLINVEKDNTFDDLKFHKDWNWLMEVVERIESLGHNVDIIQYHSINKQFCGIGKYDTIGSKSIGENKKEAVYNACIEFIKWYNKQSK